MSSRVRPEFGPTLPQLAGARWPRVRAGLLGLLALAVLLGVFRLLGGGSPERTVIVVKAPVAINVLRDDTLVKLPGHGPEELRLQSTPSASRRVFALTKKTVDSTTARQTLTIRPLRLPPYVGDDPGAALPAYATGSTAALAREIGPTFSLRGEGRTRVNLYPGYQISYEFKRPVAVNGKHVDKRFYGKRFFLYPDEPKPKAAVQLDLQAPASFYVPNPGSVGGVGPLKLPLRSFNFGTERP